LSRNVGKLPLLPAE